MKQRGPFSICTLILMALYQKPTAKTKIMQELTLTYTRTKKYLDILSKQGLIDYDAKNHAYRLTAKGIEVMKLNHQLADCFPPVRDMIKKYARFFEIPFFGANAMEDTKTVLANIPELNEKTLFK